MSTFPKEVPRGADGYYTMRLDRYDLSIEQWNEFAKSEIRWRADIATSRGKGYEVRTDVQAWPDGSTYFYTRTRTTTNVEFDSAVEAIAYHEELAKDITDRIALMESHEVPAVMDGAL